MGAPVAEVPDASTPTSSTQGGATWPVYVPPTYYTVASPEQGWDMFTKEWNNLILAEQLDDLRSAVGRDVVVEMAEVAGYTKAPKWPPFEPNYEGNTSRAQMDVDQIAAMVRAYDMKRESGVALVVVGEMLSKDEGKGCFWPTFYDIASREVLFSERFCEAAIGSGYRNYWFAPVKNVIERLEKTRGKRW